MADIDPEDKSASPSDLADQEANAGGEGDDLSQRLSAIQDKIGKGDGGFYKDEGGKKTSGLKLIGGASGAKGLLKNRKAIFGIGGGIVGGILVVGTIFNFLHTFQMDHFFKFIEQKTSQRLSASLDTRNKYLVKSYMRVRVMEIEGNTKNESLFFAANKVETGNPFRDWYATMRTSNFESDLLQKNGIAFTSVINPDGTLNIAKIQAVSSENSETAALAQKNNLGSVKTPTDLADRLNKMDPGDMEKLFTVDKLDSHKAARKSVREVVNKEVPWYRTFKRRHIRKDIANKTGIKNWRLFEKTRDKVGKSRQEIKDKLLGKIVDRYYSNNPASAQFMKCLFASGRCPSNSDPASPDAKTDSPPGSPGADDPLATADQNAETGPDGKPKPTNLDTSSGGKDITTAADKVITNEAKGEAVDVATQAAELGPMKKITLALVRTVTGGAVSDSVPFNPSKVWTWLKRIAKIDGLLYAAGKASKLSKLVMNARTSQLQGIYATYQIANDQVKSGQLVGDELNSFYDTTKNIGNSEGWAVATNQMSADGKVSAASTSNESKDAYCKRPTSGTNKRTFDEFAWFCDDQRPNNGGNADVISNSYKSSVGTVLHPIAGAVDNVTTGPIGKIADWATGAIDTVSGAIVNPVVEGLMGTTYGKDFGQFISEMMMKLLGFLGAGPMFDGTTPGVGNLLTAGAASSFEDSTRASGGVAQTEVTRAYTNEIAQNYNKEKRGQESLVERYASLNNPQSLASTVAFSLSGNLSSNEIFTKLANSIQSLPSLLGSVITGRAFAAQQDQSASYISDWAGVNKYDIPQQCQDLDPLDPNYLAKSSNVQDIAGISPAEIGIANMRDTDKFWKAVYDKIGNGADSQAKAEKIYNCALFDARAMGSVGNVFGYNKDAGYDPNGSSDTTTSQATGTSTLLGGLTFPLKVNKSTVINHQPMWCYTCQDNQHHDYNAADIFADTGTVVIAPAGGQILSVLNASGGTGSHVIMKSDTGFIFYFAHMKEGSIKVGDGQTITAGTELGEVGTDADAEGTSSHLHFDAEPSPPATTRMGCSNAECTSPNFTFVNLQPALVEAFNSLPN